MRQVHIHTDLKWSSKKQSGLEMPQLAAEWPRHPLRDQLGQHGATEGLSGYDQASQEPVGASQGHSVPLRTTSGQFLPSQNRNFENWVIVKISKS